MPTPPVIFVLNGPGLNLVGSGDARLFGTQTLDEIGDALDKRAKALGVGIDFRQSNHEGQLVDWLQEAMAKASAVILNAGGYSHTSIAIRDAAGALQIPVLEVHLSNVYAREHFRRQSFVAMRIDPALVRELAELLTENSLTEIEVEDGDRKIRVQRLPANRTGRRPIAAGSRAPARPPRRFRPNRQRWPVKASVRRWSAPPSLRPSPGQLRSSRSATRSRRATPC
jgi:3-dehydroquinate dehydratase II